MPLAQNFLQARTYKTKAVYLLVFLLTVIEQDKSYVDIVIHAVTDFKDAEVYTLEGKRMGRIKEINARYFTAFKRGLVTDEEFRIPISAISAVENYDNSKTVVRLNLKEEQVKHGYEFARGKPNSEFASGVAESEPKILREKPMVKYESSQPADETMMTAATGKPSAISEYLCDMCDEKFGSSAELQEHRAVQHKAPTGI
jgi:hypothetical protein